MTRETRIGLVVGLAFIVLFGVVLSELGPSGEEPEGRADRMSRGFYARAPVTRAPERSPQPQVVPLVARRRSAPAGGSQQPPRVARTGTDRSPTRRAAPRTARQTPTRPTRPTGPAIRPDRREMTAEEFATAYGAGARGGRAAYSRMYVTRRGDNLTAIARKFYRTPSRKAVMKIFNANRNVLRSPDSLGVGVKIVIPN